MVTVKGKEFDIESGVWTVFAVVELADGTRSGSFQVQAAADATEQALAAALEGLFAGSPSPQSSARS